MEDSAEEQHYGDEASDENDYGNIDEDGKDNEFVAEK